MEVLAQVRCPAQHRHTNPGAVVPELILKTMQLKNGLARRNGVPIFPVQGALAPDHFVVNRLRN